MTSSSSSSSSSSSAAIVAVSSDGSLVAVHHPPPPPSSSSSAKTDGRGGSVIRCYGGSGASDGSLRFTLRVPPPPSSSSSSPSSAGGGANVADSAGGKESSSVIRKLVFNGGDGGREPSRLCGMASSPSSRPSSSSSFILVWDLDRGVLAKTIDVRDVSSSSSSSGGESAEKKKKKRRKSTSSSVGGAGGGEGKEVLRDIAARGDRLLALVFLPSEEGEGGGGAGGGKCRLYEYDLSSEGGGRLSRKVRVGRVRGSAAVAASAAPLGVVASRDRIVVRLAGRLRAFDAASGERLCEADVVGGEGDSSSFAPLGVSPDGRHVVCSAGDRRAALFSCAAGGGNAEADDDDDGDGGGLRLEAVALLHAEGGSPIASLDVVRRDGADELAVLAFQPAIGAASLFAAPARGGSSNDGARAPLAPRATLAPAGAEPRPILIHGAFHPRRPHESLLLLFQKPKSKSGSASGRGAVLPSETMGYADLRGKVEVGSSVLLSEEGGANESKRKRQAENNVALAPGERGAEAAMATDLSAAVAEGGSDKKEKRARASSKEGEHDDDVLGDAQEEGEGGQSIAERLALLSSAMEHTDEEDSEEEEDEYDEDGELRPRAAEGSNARKSKPRAATSETLTALLTQALSSNDSVQLNAALQVTDRRLVEGTVRALQALDAERPRGEGEESGAERYLPALVAHVVRRMARKHSLVGPMAVWVSAVLAALASATARSSAGGERSSEAEMRVAREARDMASRLGPLRNFLDERAECLPQLLRLEGRLALLGRQF